MDSIVGCDIEVQELLELLEFRSSGVQEFRRTELIEYLKFFFNSLNYFAGRLPHRTLIFIKFKFLLVFWHSDTRFSIEVRAL
jgi:hypothetical protein